MCSNLDSIEEFEKEILDIQKQINATQDLERRSELGEQRAKLLQELETANDVIKTQNEEQVVSSEEFAEAQRKAA